MARSGDTDFQFNPGFFEATLRQPKVEALVDAAGDRTLAAAQADAPEDSGAYKAGLHIEHRQSRYRRVTRVVGGDPKTLIIESTKGVLARAVKKARQ